MKNKKKTRKKKSIGKPTVKEQFQTMQNMFCSELANITSAIATTNLMIQTKFKEMDAKLTNLETKEK